VGVRRLPERATAAVQSSSKPVACRLYPARPRGASVGPVRHGAVRIGEARRGPARLLEAATLTPAATAGPGGVYGNGTVSVVSMGAGGRLICFSRSSWRYLPSRLRDVESVYDFLLF